jgi:hypothetical protein
VNRRAWPAGLVGRLRPGVLVLVGLAAAAGFVCGVLVDRPSPPNMAVVGPAVSAGVDRSAPSREGAVAAGVRYATLLAQLFPADRAAAERAAADAASAGYRDVLVAAVDRQLVPLQRQAGRLPGSTVYRQAVLATRLEGYAPPRARVSVWVLATVGQTGQQVNPIASFTTFTLDLVWERAAWRLDGTGQRPGPTPLTDGQPQQVDEFDAALAGFTDWRPA